MTYIEFFTKTSIENICSCLTEAPDRLILIGDSSKAMKRCIRNFQKIFSKRGKDIEFLFKTVSKWNLSQMEQVLEEIITTYEDCVFCITGGDEIALFTLGMVYERNRDKNIQIHRMGIRNNKIYDFDKDGNTIFEDVPQLSVEDNIIVYGGDVVYGDIDEENTYRWNLTKQFCDDVETIWSICKADVRKWNIQISVLETLGEVGVTSDDGLQVIATKEEIQNYYYNRKEKYSVNQDIINKLCREGLLMDFEETDTEVIVKYKDLQVKKCLTKAGQALEMKIFLTAKEVKDTSGKYIYNDVLNGVVIDWDGELHEEEEEKFDTVNEIDVMMMHDMIPVFVSCKNGQVTTEELYKLNTVANRFGGEYAKKVLVATNLSRLGDGEEYFKQRAADMGIQIIENVHKMTNDELAKKLAGVWF